MSFIVYGVTDSLCKKIAVEEYGYTHKDTENSLFGRLRSRQLSGELPSPEVAKEFVSLILRDCKKHKNICIKQKERFLDSATKRYRTKTKVFLSFKEPICPTP